MAKTTRNTEDQVATLHPDALNDYARVNTEPKQTYETIDFQVANDMQPEDLEGMPVCDGAMTSKMEFVRFQAFVAGHKYLPRLLGILERAQRVEFDLNVEDGKFHVKHTGKEWFADMVVSLPGVLTDDPKEVANTMTDLEDLERYVETAEQSKAERVRVEKVRQAALAKLDVEERRALGL